MSFKKRSLRGAWMALLVVMLLILVFNPALAQEREKPLVALSLAFYNHPWTMTMCHDVEYWVKKAGMDFIWTDGEFDSANQLADCEDLIGKSPDFFCIFAKNAEALAPVYDMCNKARIPLIVIDRYINATPGTGMYIKYLGQDHSVKGRVTARFLFDYLIKKYPDKKEFKIIEIQHEVGSDPGIERHKGFQEVISSPQYSSRFKCIASQSGRSQREYTLHLMEDLLQRFPKGEVDGIASHSDEESIGIVAAIKEQNRNELLGNITSIDGQRQTLKSILDGEILATIDCSPYYGKYVARTAVKYLNREPIKEVEWIGNILYHCQTEKGREITQKKYDYMMSEDLYY